MQTKVKYNNNTGFWEVWTMIDKDIFSAGEYVCEQDARQVATDLENLPRNSI